MVSLPAPIITFTFDDFPRSAWDVAAPILEDHGARATYFTSYGLAGTTTPTGLIFAPDDLAEVQAHGHELACHTFHHLPAWETAPDVYVRSVEMNAAAHLAVAGNKPFQTHSYPISYPRPATKRRLSRRFRACRGGGQAPNVGRTDLNYLNSFFLEQARGATDAVRAVVELNRQNCGWLIFSTHDVCPQPTPYGVTPEFFRAAVETAAQSGARLLPMAVALDHVLGVRRT